MSPESELPVFKDDPSKIDRFGFSDFYGRPQLPGLSWESGNMFTTSTFMPNCNMEDGVFSDTAWGFGSDAELNVRQEAPVLEALFYSDAMRRLQAIEQLSLPPEYTTIPNTAAFSRFEHVWGSVLFVKKLAEQQGLSDTEKLTYQLRTVLSDMAHTTGSHLGDWLFQGVGSSEDQHDNELADYLDKVGVIEILEGHGIDPAEVIFPDTQDWVEASSPNLCVDRVDYALREMNRWNYVVKSQAFNAGDFVITPDNKLAMKDQQRARVFAEGYLLLSEEHWSEPTHRFIEALFLLRTKLFYAQSGAPDTWLFTAPDQLAGLVPLHEIHPRDLMYVTDPTQLASLARPSLGGNTIDSIARFTAQYRRQYVWAARSSRIQDYMYQFADPKKYAEILSTGTYTPLESDDFDTYLDEYPQALPIGLSFHSADELADQPTSEDYIDFVQPAFKVRQIDPLVQVGDEFLPLSQLDVSFAERLQEHRTKLEQTSVARLAIPDKATRSLLQSIVSSVEIRWQERLASSRRLSPAELKRLTEGAAREIHGRYPFLSFLSY